MYRILKLGGYAALMLIGGVLQAQAQLTMNAAAEEPVQGWQKMEIEGRAVWVNPKPALTSADIQGAEPATDPNYNGNFVKVFFSEVGAKKMRELTTAQMNKLIAMVLDGKLISAPSRGSARASGTKCSAQVRICAVGICVSWPAMKPKACGGTSPVVSIGSITKSMMAFLSVL